MMISFLKHPLVAFDLYVHELLLRIIGELYSSYSWLCMKKIDNLVQQLTHELSNVSSNRNSNLHINNIANRIQTLIDTLQSTIRNIPFQNSQAEYSTGLTYPFLLSFNNSLIKQSTDQLFVHTMKLMCMIACVIDETALPNVLTSNLASGSTSISAAQQSTVQPTPIQQVILIYLIEY